MNCCLFLLLLEPGPAASVPASKSRALGKEPFASIVHFLSLNWLPLVSSVLKVSIDQVRDARGELANMSAGSLKPLLPPPCQLSLPAVADGSDYNFTVPQGEILLTQTFTYGAGTMRITILKRKRG